MVTHWESSRRPLYVRTIWKDGQHHVILDKTKENQLNTFTSKRSKQYSSSQNSHRTSKSSSTSVNFKVSSVRVLLSGIKAFKKSKKENNNKIIEKANERPKTWTQTPASKPLSYKDLNKEVSFHAIQGFRPPNLLKSNTIELPEARVPEKCLLDNVLSERVMVWLDLATTNASIDKGERNLTVQACDFTKNKDEKKLSFPELKECLDCTNVNTIVDSSILKNASPRQDLSKKKEDIVIYCREEAGIPKENFYHVLTPRLSMDIEDYTYKENEKDEEEEKVNTIKRQLHIFMPNLPNKNSSDCNSSILSSKISVT